MASCFATGAASVSIDSVLIEKMRLIGEYAGIAFQIKDDLFDFDTGNKTGKPSSIDIKEKKMTLPLIYLLSQSSLLEKRKIINIVKRHNTDANKVAWLINRVKESGGLEFTQEKMQEYKNKALDLLNDFPNNKAKESLVSLIEYIISRNN
jgi:octaprenyl-diphosphate synthase